jgi:hypothetical protein
MHADRARGPSRRAKKRTYNTRLIKRDYTYFLREIAELFEVYPRAVRRGIKGAMPLIDECRPFLSHGRDLIAFLDARQTRRKQPRAADELCCLRCRRLKAGGHGTSSNVALRPAHPFNRVIAQLNERRMVIDDTLQWILPRRKGSPREKNSGRRARSFRRTREALLRCVCEKCGAIGPEAGFSLQDLPEWHADWDCKNLDVRRTDPAHNQRCRKPLSAKVSEASDADE